MAIEGLSTPATDQVDVLETEWTEPQFHDGRRAELMSLRPRQVTKTGQMSLLRLYQEIGVVVNGSRNLFESLNSPCASRRSLLGCSPNHDVRNDRTDGRVVTLRVVEVGQERALSAAAIIDG